MAADKNVLLQILIGALTTLEFITTLPAHITSIIQPEPFQITVKSQRLTAKLAAHESFGAVLGDPHSYLHFTL